MIAAHVDVVKPSKFDSVCRVVKAKLMNVYFIYYTFIHGKMYTIP
jgi:hypothetical protein